MTQPVGMTWQVYDPRVYTTSMQQFPPHPPPPYAQQPLPPYAFAPPGMYPMAMQQPQLVYAPAPTVMPMLPQAVGQNSTRSSRDRKDMKKRTKIKCDEGHPICRRCQKSKRECLGYRPVFREVQDHYYIRPAADFRRIQQEANLPPSDSIATDNVYLSVRSYQDDRDDQMAADTTASTTNTHGAFEYGEPFDPAVVSGNGHSPGATVQRDLRLQSIRNTRPITIDQLFDLNDIPPRYHVREARVPDSPITHQQIDEFYHHHYAKGLDRFFETDWYSSHGLTHLHHHPVRLDFIMQCAEQFAAPAQDAACMQALQSLEARLVWQLVTLPCDVAVNPSTNNNIDPALDVTHPFLPRIAMLEALLTGQGLNSSDIPSASSSTPGYAPEDFWHHLATLLSQSDDKTTTPILRTLRTMLHSQENRDVLYSLAIGRCIGGRLRDLNPFQPLPASSVSESTINGGEGDDDDDDNELLKLEVARRFVEIESLRGGNQVVQRICGMGMRGWELLAGQDVEEREEP